MIYGYVTMGYEGVLVSIEVDMTNSIPGLEIVGLASNEVKEAKERVRIAIRSSGFHWPGKRIFINLSPADIKKKGAGFDLPIALAILEASGQIQASAMNIMALGELQFNGNVRPVRNVLAATSCAIDNGIHHMVISSLNARESFALDTMQCCVVGHLSDIKTSIQFLQKEMYEKKMGDMQSVSNARFDSSADVRFDSSAVVHTIGGENAHKKKMATEHKKPSVSDLSFCDDLKRVIQIVAAGRHNVHFSGIPGSGKTASAMRISSLLPSLHYRESLEVSKIYALSNGNYHSRHTSLRNDSSQNANREAVLITERPIRIPHHTASVEGIIGSAVTLVPGEISLAHTGILILDEAPEFKMQILQSLREPMDSHEVHISRASQKWQCPADFQLVLTSNLCPCGNLGRPSSSGQWCLCSEKEIFKYWKRIGGAIWDRIDIKYKTQYKHRDKEESMACRLAGEKKMYDEVQQALMIQKERSEHSGIFWNARYELVDIEKYFFINDDAGLCIQAAVRKYGASERGRMMVAKIGRTIADLDQSEYVLTRHIDEAVFLAFSVNPSNLHAMANDVQEFVSMLEGEG